MKRPSVFLWSLRENAKRSTVGRNFWVLAPWTISRRVTERFLWSGMGFPGRLPTMNRCRPAVCRIWFFLQALERRVPTHNKQSLSSCTQQAQKGCAIRQSPAEESILRRIGPLETRGEQGESADKLS